MKFRDFHYSLVCVASLSCFTHLSVSAQSVQDPHTTRLDDVTITARSLENTGYWCQPSNSRAQHLHNVLAQP